MARPRSGAKVRLNLDIPEKERALLENLRERTGAASFTEVIRRALAVYDFLWDEKTGGSVVIRNAEGEEYKLLLR